MNTARILSALVLALAAALAAFWLLPSEPWRPPSSVRPEISRLSQNEAPARPAAAEQVLARPLFWPSRRPAEATAQAPSPGFAENTQVLGLLGQGDRTVAIIRYEDNVLRLTPGVMLAGWRFEGVEGESAVFARSGGERQLIPIPRKTAQELPRGTGTRPPRADAPAQPPRAAPQRPAARAGQPARRAPAPLR